MTIEVGDYAVVCTDKRGVFAGELASIGDSSADVTLREARMCIYWSASVMGVVGLSNDGPNTECRVTKPAPEMWLPGVTCVMRCTPRARAAWEAQPWAD